MVFVKRGALPKFAIVIPQPAATTVLHLKKAIRRHFELSQQRELRAAAARRGSTEASCRKRNRSGERGHARRRAAAADKRDRDDSDDDEGKGEAKQQQQQPSSSAPAQSELSRRRERRSHRAHRSATSPARSRSRSSAAARSHSARSSSSSTSSQSSTSSRHRNDSSPPPPRTPQLARISWPYIWRTYSLQLDDGAGGLRLADDRAALSAYGVRHKCELRFVRRRALRRNQAAHS